MKKIIFLIVTVLISCHFMACQESNQGADLRKSWQYSQAYMEFEYVSDTIYFGSATNQMNMSVSDFKQMFLGVAASKMQSYFKGIDIFSFDSLSIKVQRATGQVMNLKASYFNDDQFIEINFNKNMMAALMGASADMIPAISFKYTLLDEQLTIFLNEVYVQSIFENLQIQNMLTPMIVRKLNPMFDRMPQQAQQAMLTGIQEQLSQIIDDFQKLKIGFILK